jgi:hypothetical protein
MHCLKWCHAQAFPECRLPRTSSGIAITASRLPSPEELTFVLSRRLHPVVAVLDVVRWIRAAPISSREHPGTKVTG